VTEISETLNEDLRRKKNGGGEGRKNKKESPRATISTVLKSSSSKRGIEHVLVAGGEDYRLDREREGGSKYGESSLPKKNPS